MGLNDRRSVLGVNAPYRVVFPIPDGKTLSNPTEGSDFRQVGYSYRGFNRYEAGGGGGTLYIDSASIVNYLRNSHDTSLSIASEASIPSRIIVDNQAALLIGSINSLFYSLRIGNEERLAYPNESSVIKRWGSSSDSRLNIESVASSIKKWASSSEAGILFSNESSVLNRWAASAEAGVALSSESSLINRWLSSCEPGIAFPNDSSLLHRWMASAAGGMALQNESSVVSRWLSSVEAAVGISSESSLINRWLSSADSRIDVSSESALINRWLSFSEAGIAFPNESSLFGNWLSSAAGGVSLQSESSIIKRWDSSTNGGLNIGSNIGLFSHMLAGPLGELLINSASSISSQFRTDNPPYLAVSSQAGLLGLFNINADSTVLGNLIGECSSAINFAIGTIAALSLSSSINVRTESILGGDNGISSLNSANIRANLVADTVPAVVGSLIGLCDMATSLRLSAGEQLLIGSAINLLSTTKLENLPALSINSVIPIIKRIESQISPSLSIGAVASLTNNFVLQEDISLLMNALSNLIKEWKTTAGGGLFYYNSADLSVNSAISPLVSVFLNSIFAATATFGKQNSGSLNLASEVYFINRLATESNIRASIVGAVDLAGRFHIFAEEPEVNGLGQFYVADFILRRKSLEELNLYRVALSHNNLHVQQSSLKDLSLSQIRSYILQIKDAGLFEVNRRI